MNPPTREQVAALSEEMQAFFHERAGIFEHDGQLPREVAEARAWQATLKEMNHTPDNLL